MFQLKRVKNYLREKFKDQLTLVKEGLSKESDETKNMLRIYLRYTQGQASKDQMKAANIQFRSFLKTLGLGALAVLPFSPITIPAIVKFGKFLGIDILPKGFKEKEDSE